MMSVRYGIRDVDEDDEVFHTEQGILLRKGNTDLYLRFRNLAEFAGWLERNAEKFKDHAMLRIIAEKLKQGS